MNKDELDIIPTRLNDDAPIWRGCSLKEIVWLTILCFVIFTALGMFLMEMLFGKLVLGIVVGVIGAWGGVYVTTSILQRFKQGKPRGYIKQKLVMYCEKIGFYKSPLLRHSSRFIAERKIRSE